MRAQAATDPVTGIDNRARFDEQIEREVDLATHFGKCGCLMMVDLDHFVARTVAERGLTAVRLQEVAYSGLEEPIRITVSMGIWRLRVGKSAQSWIERADRALYAAKGNGRDRIEADPIDLDEG